MIRITTGGCVTTTRADLVGAFKVWNERYVANPDDFIEPGKDSGEMSADYLIGLIEELDDPSPGA